MSMETVTVYADQYYAMQDREFENITILATLTGRLSALSEMDDNTNFVMSQLKEIVDELKNGKIRG